MAVDCLYVDSHCQLCCNDAGATSRLGDLLAAVPARVPFVHRPVHVRAAVCCQMEERAMKDWRDETLARMRALILEADPDMVEERKWKKPSNNMTGVPVWSHNGIVCTGETYKKAVKLTFAQGARIADPSRLFNSSLEGRTRRAIDIHEGETVDPRAFKALVKAAVAHNGAQAKKR